MTTTMTITSTMIHILPCISFGKLPSAPLPDAAGRTCITISASAAGIPGPALPAGAGAAPSRLALAAIAILIILLLLKLLDTVTLLLMASRQKSALRLLQEVKKCLVKKHRRPSCGSSAENEDACLAGGIDKDIEADDEEDDEEDNKADEKTGIETDNKTDIRAAQKEILSPQKGNPTSGEQSPAAQSCGLSSQMEDLTEQGEGGSFGREPAVPPAPDPFKSGASCLSVSVNNGIHLNPCLPVTLDPDESSSSMLEIYDGSRVRPKETCFCGYNSAAFFSRYDFFRVFDFIGAEGQSLPCRGQIRLLSTRSPAIVRTDHGQYLLVKKGVLEAEEKTG